MIIIGLPLLLSGKLGQQALDIKNAVTNLQTEIEIPINLFDERLTTQQSYKILKETQTKNSKINEKIDEVSACLILQSYIDSNHHEV